MNIPLLRKIQRKFREFPQIVYMEDWQRDTKKRAATPCGTVGCIAGHVVLMEDGKKKLKRLFLKHSNLVLTGMSLPIPRRAADLLDLDPQQADALFFVDSWPYRFWSSHRTAGSQTKVAEVVCDRINHFIKTGK